MSAFTLTETQTVSQTATQPDLEFLSFRLGAEEYGIDLLSVQEIRGWEPPTRLAGSSPCVLGVLNLRGVIVPVADLRLRLGLPAAYDAMTVTVIVNMAGRTVGLVVDAVSTVIALTPAQIRPPPALRAAALSAPLLGIACVQDESCQRLMLLIDIQRLLAQADLGLAA